MLGSTDDNDRPLSPPFSAPGAATAAEDSWHNPIARIISDALPRLD